MRDEDEEWRRRAACRPRDESELVEGVAKFFPVRRAYQLKMETTRRERDALAVCEACPVRVECLSFSLKNRIEHGVWGGVTEQERKKLLRRRSAS